MIMKNQIERRVFDDAAIRKTTAAYPYARQVP